MSRGADLYRGNRVQVPLLGLVKLPGRTSEVTDRVVSDCPFGVCDYFEDFLGRMAALPDTVYGRTVTTAGVPTINLDADAANGAVACLLANTNEVEYAGIDWQDQRTIPANKQPVFNAYVSPSTIAANERCVIGLCSDFNSTLGSTTVNAWFRLNGSMALTAEADDNTTDTDLFDVSRALTASTYYLFSIDLGASPGRAIYYLNGDCVADLPFDSAPSTTLQPIIGVQKDSGTGTPQVSVDFWRVWWARL